MLKLLLYVLLFFINVFFFLADTLLYVTDAFMSLAVSTHRTDDVAEMFRSISPVAVSSL